MPACSAPVARRLFVERFAQLSQAAAELAAAGVPRLRDAAQQLLSLSRRAERGFDLAPAVTLAAPVARATAPVTASAGAAAPPAPVAEGEGVERIAGAKLDLIYEGKRCIHSRFCVTGAPQVFLANVQGPWIHPDAIPVERLVEIAHECPAGAIRYRRRDGVADEGAPPVNLASVREAGPYAFRAELTIDGEPAGYRVTLCRCGASKHKPFCDGSHHEAGFSASGEPASGQTTMLPVRYGRLIRSATGP